MGYMVGSLPWSLFSLEGGQLDPVQRIQVQDAYSVESLFVGASTSEEKQLMVVLVVVEGAVASFLGEVSMGDNFFPL